NCSACASAFAGSTAQELERGAELPSAILPSWNDAEWESLCEFDGVSSAFPSDCAWPTPMGPEPFVPESSDRRPKELGDYVLLDRLGVGGMGVVYRARHRLLGKERAVKVLRRGYFAEGGGCAEIRFMREIQAGGKLEHPNVVAVVDAGQDNGEL